MIQKFCDNKDFHLLEHKDIKEAADVLAKAFLTYPLHQYVFEKEKNNLECFFQWYFECLLKAYSKTNIIRVIGKPIVGICVYSLPRQSSPSTLDFILAGFYKLPFKVSLSSILKLIRVNGLLTKFKKTSQKEDVAYIDILAIDPCHQGKGLGKQLFQFIANQFNGVKLVTHKLENLKFYEELKCKLEQTEQLPNSSLITYLMGCSKDRKLKN